VNTLRIPKPSKNFLVISLLLLVGMGIPLALYQTQIQQRLKPFATNNDNLLTPTPTSPLCKTNQGFCRWNLLEGANSYTVTVKEKDSGEIIQSETIDHPASESAFVMELDKTYSCTVTPNNSCGNGQASTSAEKQCLQETSTPTPTIPICKENEPIKEAACRWDPMENATNYHVEIMNTATGKTIATENIVAPATHVVFPAEAGKSYTCKVNAINSCGEGKTGTGKTICPVVTGTPTPTPTITPTMTATPTVTITPTPSPTATPTPTPTKKPTPTPTLRPTSTPGPPPPTQIIRNNQPRQPRSPIVQNIQPTIQVTILQTQITVTATPAPTVAPTGDTTPVVMFSIGTAVLLGLGAFFFLL
jgi:hypothetical protein